MSKKDVDHRDRIEELEDQVKKSQDKLGNFKEIQHELEEERQERKLKQLEVDRIKSEFENVKSGMEKGFIALTKNLGAEYGVGMGMGQAAAMSGSPGLQSVQSEQQAQQFRQLSQQIQELQGQLTAQNAQAAQQQALNAAQQQTMAANAAMSAGGAGSSPNNAGHAQERRLQREIDDLRAKNKKLENEISQMRQEMAITAAAGTPASARRGILKQQAIDAERIQDLEAQLMAAQKAGGGKAAPGGSKILQHKVTFLKKQVGELEREKAKLMMRASSAEEQLAATQMELQRVLSGGR